MRPEANEGATAYVEFRDVEVAYNEIQKSPSYPSGFALRFARITRVRDDKAPPQATSLDELRQLYERQFAAKGRAAE